MKVSFVLLVVAILCLVDISLCDKDPPAPDTFNVVFKTTKGILELTATRSWSPNGVDRFYALIKSGYFNNNAFFRVIQSPQPFVAQWGIAADPAVSAKWANLQIPNDPMVKSNLRGFVSFAAEMQGNLSCCRTTQLFINYGNNSFLDQYEFTPFAFVTSGMDFADQFYSGYGEDPDQNQIYSQGNTYLKQNFPLLDYLVSATLQK